MDRDSSLVVSFLREAREVGLGENRLFQVAPNDLLNIAATPAGRAEFQRELGQLNDVDLRRLIIEYVLDLADRLEDEGDAVDRRVDLLDRTGLSVAGAVTTAGIGTTVAFVANTAAIGSVFGPLGLLGGGLIGLIAVGVGRTVLKGRSDENRSAARRLRRLVEKI